MGRQRNHDRLKPALRYHVLTPYFDRVLRITMREQSFKQQLIQQANLESNQRIIDVGCGTATLAVLIKQQYPEVEMIGLDGDIRVLELARNKIHRSGLNIQLEHGMSDKMPYQNQSADRVVSSLVFHHLTNEQKIQTLKEMYRVLRHGGEIHIADFGKAQNGFLRGVFFLAQLAEGFITTKDNVKGMIPLYMEQVGFHHVQEVDRMATVYGTLSFYKGIK